MPNVAIRTRGHQAAGGRICRGMKAAQSKRQPCPQHECDSSDLHNDEYRAGGERGANAPQTEQSCDNDEVADYRKTLNNNVRDWVPTQLCVRCLKNHSGDHHGTLTGPQMSVQCPRPSSAEACNV